MSTHRLALEAAAAGLVSGTLAEWPFLSEALDETGHSLPRTAGVSEMRAAARSALQHFTRSDADEEVGCCQHCDKIMALGEDAAATRAVVERIEQSMVTRGEFRPVRSVAYGLVGLIGLSFIGAVVAAVLK